MGFDLSSVWLCSSGFFWQKPKAIFFFQALRNIQLLHSVTCHTGRTKIYIYFFSLLTLKSKIATIFSVYAEFCSCVWAFVMWLECSWDEGSRDASCPFWMPRRAQAPIERVTIGAIFPSNHRLFERVLGAAKFTATADLSPPKKSYLTFNRNSRESDGLFSAKCLRCNSFVNLKRTDKKWTCGVKWWRQL